MKKIEYESWDALRRLEKNPTLKFTCTQGGITFILSCQGTRIILVSDAGISSYFALGDKWTLVKEPVDFKTAVNAYAKGYDLKLVVGDYFYFFKDHNIEHEGTLRQFIDTDGNGVNCSDIVEGKWYILGEEEEEE